MGKFYYTKIAAKIGAQAYTSLCIGGKAPPPPPPKKEKGPCNHVVEIVIKSNNLLWAKSKWECSPLQLIINWSVVVVVGNGEQWPAISNNLHKP